MKRDGATQRPDPPNCSLYSFNPLFHTLRKEYSVACVAPSRYAAYQAAGDAPAARRVRLAESEILSGTLREHETRTLTSFPQLRSGHGRVRG